MNLRKHVPLFFARVLIVYAVLIVPWPGLQSMYHAAYATTGNIVFGRFGPNGTVHVRPARPDEGDAYVRFELRHRASSVVVTTKHDARLIGYLPTALTIALILATPAPTRKRWRGVAWGLVLVHGFIALRVLIFLVHEFTGDESWRLFDPPPFWQHLLRRTFDFVVAAPTLTFVAPVFIWLLTMGPTLRRLARPSGGT